MTGPYPSWRDNSTISSHDFVLIAATASLTVKSTESEIFVWVTDLKTAQPVADVPVTLYYNGIGHLLGKTDAQGIARGPLSFVDRAKDEWNGHSTQVYVVAQAAGVYGAWYSCYGYWQVQRTRKDFLYTDRPIYRPGETVNVKGILRNRNDMEFSPADVKTVSLTLFDGEQQLAHVTATVNRDGTYTAAFKLPDNTALGNAYISVDDPLANTEDEQGVPKSSCPHSDWYYRNDPCSYTVSFTVAAFRPPEIEVGVSTDQHEIIQGDPLNFDVAASFYSGGVVSNTAFDWTVYSTVSYFSYTGSGSYSFDDERWYNSYYYEDYYKHQPLTSDKATTGSDGKQHVEATKTLLTDFNNNYRNSDDLPPGMPPVN